MKGAELINEKTETDRDIMQLQGTELGVNMPDKELDPLAKKKGKDDEKKEDKDEIIKLKGTELDEDERLKMFVEKFAVKKEPKIIKNELEKLGIKFGGWMEIGRGDKAKCLYPKFNLIDPKDAEFLKSLPDLPPLSSKDEGWEEHLKKLHKFEKENEEWFKKQQEKEKEQSKKKMIKNSGCIEKANTDQMA